MIQTQSSLFAHASKKIRRESERNVHDIDQNDPTAREMSNTDILDSLETQANKAINIDCFLFLMWKQLPACMRDISKIALQACIMNSSLSLHSLESKIFEIQKIRENVSSKRHCFNFQRVRCVTFDLGILMETGVPDCAEAEMV